MTFEMTANKFRVTWKRKAAEKFGKLFNVDHRRGLINSKHILSINPFHFANGFADYPGYEFNGYCWVNVNNVILIYRVHSDEKLVSIETCYSALTGEIAEIFYDVSPDDEEE